jgi:quercetin dioxygenase-like cupin family protein
MTWLPMRTSRHASVVAMIVMLSAMLGGTASGAAPTTSQDGITRTILAQAIPGNASGQTLYLEEVRIAPKAKLATHLHEGTQIASVRSGVLTYNIISGTVTVTRADGSTKDVAGPATVQLRRGDAITETPTVVHYGANKGKVPVVILLSALLATGAPLATPVTTTPS